MTSPLHIVVLAAGQSSRMKSKTSKILHSLAGWSVLRHVLEVAKALSPETVILVTSPEADAIAEEGKDVIADLKHVVQEQPQGTGDAVKTALPHLEHASGTVLVLYGDSPLMQPDTLRRLIEARSGHQVALTAMQPFDPAHYGRVVLDEAGQVEAIVEYKDASEEQRTIRLCNAGVMALAAGAVPELLSKLSNDNAKKEYYLTDVVKLVKEAGGSCGYIVADEEEMLGVNNRAELAYAEGVMQWRLRRRALDAGVGMVAPETVFLSMDTQFGEDVMLHPHVVIGKGVSIKDDVEIRSFSHLEGATVEAGATVGPYARLRPGAVIGHRAGVGNFVEIKNAQLAEGVKIGHLSYIGDAEVGANTNIGAGTITCNYDGRHKHQTVIGRDVFIGSDTSLVAPVTVADGATIGAGSVITEDVPEYGLSIARGKQVNKPDWRK